MDTDHVASPTAPILTARLELRPHRPDDAAAYGALWRPPAEGPALTPVLDAEGTWARLLRLIGHRTVFGFAPWLVTDRETGAIVGEAGFARFHRGIGPEFDEAPEAMWILDAARRGRGLAAEAMAAAIAAFDATVAAPRTVAMIDPINTVSIRLAERLGFRHYGEGLHHATRMLLFERPRGG